MFITPTAVVSGLTHFISQNNHPQGLNSQSKHAECNSEAMVLQKHYIWSNKYFHINRSSGCMEDETWQL